MNSFYVAEARLERTTFGLWAQRATTAPLRDILWLQKYCFYLNWQAFRHFFSLFEYYFINQLKIMPYNNQKNMYTHLDIIQSRFTAIQSTLIDPYDINNILSILLEISIENGKNFVREYTYTYDTRDIYFTLYTKSI